jgi:hypothetical protein
MTDGSQPVRSTNRGRQEDAHERLFALTVSRLLSHELITRLRLAPRKERRVSDLHRHRRQQRSLTGVRFDVRMAT